MGLLVKKKLKKKKKTKRMRSALHKRERGFFFTVRTLSRAPRVATFYYSTLSHYDSTKMNAFKKQSLSSYS